MPRSHRAPPQPDGALLRLKVSGDAWAEGLPPVPHGFTVTVSFSSEDAAAGHAEALTLIGYTDVGVGPCALATSAPVADFVVPQVLLEAHPTWWRALAGQAERAYSLALGPVLAGLADVLRVHQQPTAR